MVHNIIAVELIARGEQRSVTAMDGISERSGKATGPVAASARSFSQTAMMAAPISSAMRSS